ncbi:hypothetical protein CAPTEDRAFT_208357 [Capitella teleta]|uniref:Uncharacterized protein n=1 Tax=Capitella teleta TaxID=283909 RepID=R7V1Z5_CAPTE|nr:hypothetical protein CAPTEDRAFT_208357 [Capitella teleta]|eukprot:ELU09701.1 hypothetical protein CAPTEDRAFT_208357 [Capitella teleta]
MHTIMIGESIGNYSEMIGSQSISLVVVQKQRKRKILPAVTDSRTSTIDAARDNRVLECEECDKYKTLVSIHKANHCRYFSGIYHTSGMIREPLMRNWQTMSTFERCSAIFGILCFGSLGGKYRALSEYTNQSARDNTAVNSLTQNSRQLSGKQAADPTMLGFADSCKGQHKRSQKDNGSSCPLFKPHQGEDYKN